MSLNRYSPPLAAKDMIYQLNLINKYSSPFSTAVEFKVQKQGEKVCNIMSIKSFFFLFFFMEHLRQCTSSCFFMLNLYYIFSPFEFCCICSGLDSYRVPRRQRFVVIETKELFDLLMFNYYLI